MAELVTMVFTDLVSSTAVKGQMPGRDLAERNVRYFEDILKPHRLRVEATLAAASGRVVSTQGDGYFLVFSDLLAAVHWSVALQRDHQTNVIPTPLGPLAVKVALHVGSPLLDGDNFIGHEVDYAARVGALCRGGQILVSESVAALLRDARIGGLELFSHGDHLLKGVGSVPVYEVLYDARAPSALKTDTAPVAELPPAPDTFVGRQTLLESLTAAVARGGVVVLKGEGGMGKTALALTVAHRHASHAPTAWVYGEQSPTLEDCLRDVALAFWDDPQDSLTMEARQRRIQAHSERSGALIVVDNFETVACDIDIARWIASWRPPATMLVTSREAPAALRGTVLGVHELPRAEAVRLFCDRLILNGGTVPSDTRVVDDLCAAVGDAPLAVELLAGRAARVPLTRLLERLRQSLKVLDAGGDPHRPARHQSAQACFAVSYDTLSEPAQQMLTRLAMWPDGIGLELLHTSMGMDSDWDEAAEELVGASVWRLAEERYEVHPLVRQFALEKLGPQRPAVLRAGVEAMARVAAAKSQRLKVESPTAVSAAVEWFDDEWPNLLTAVDIAFEEQAWSVVRALADSIEDYWEPRSLLRDAEDVFQKALQACRQLADAAGEAAVLQQLEMVQAATQVRDSLPAS